MLGSVVVSVQGAVDDGCDHSFGIMGEQRVFQHAFAGAGFAEHQTQAAPFSEFETRPADPVMARVAYPPP